MTTSMQPLLTAAAMREADRATIEDLGLPGFTLMETAGRGATDALERQFGSLSGKHLVCCCGKGNNGGDGLVVARVALARGARATVLLLGDEAGLTPDAALNLLLLRHLMPHVADRLDLVPYTPDLDLDRFAGADLYVDALLGTGLTSAVRSPIREVVTWVNGQAAPTVALDVPTGLHSDTGAVLGAAVRAALTVPMGAAKVGLYLGAGPEHAGTVVPVEIGIPGHQLHHVCRTFDGCAWQTTDVGVAAWLPQRARDAHKYSAGLVLAVAGAPGLTGAPVMASTAATRVGAGAVVCASPASVYPTLAAHFTEVMPLALPEGADGLDAVAALKTLAPRLRQAKALLVGCGLGRQPATQAFVRTLLAQADLPLVLDADGLNAVAGHLDDLAAQASGRWILTPHAGEFRRLAGDDVDLADPVQTAVAYAQRWNVVLVLKGMPSVVGCPDGTAYVCGTGNPALATAGTGDVLAGLCAGLLAQGLAPTHAAACALHLGGAAADAYSRTRAPASLIATDLLHELPAVLAALAA